MKFQGRGTHGSRRYIVVRDIATYLPNASTSGYGKYKAKAGDFVVFRPEGHDERSVGRVVGQIVECDDQGPNCAGQLLVMTLSDGLTFAYENWVDPKDVKECIDSARPQDFLNRFMAMSPAELWKMREEQ